MRCPLLANRENGGFKTSMLPSSYKPTLSTNYFVTRLVTSYLTVMMCVFFKGTTWTPSITTLMRRSGQHWTRPTWRTQYVSSKMWSVVHYQFNSVWLFIWTIYLLSGSVQSLFWSTFSKRFVIWLWHHVITMFRDNNCLLCISWIVMLPTTTGRAVVLWNTYFPTLEVVKEVFISFLEVPSAW